LEAVLDTAADLVSRLACSAVRARGFTRQPRGTIKLNLGSGPTGVVPGWVCVDASVHLLIRWLPERVLRQVLRHTDVGEDAALGLKRGTFVFWDLRYGIPFTGDAAEAVFSSHLLEHLSDSEAARLLSDISRVLIPGGVLRVVVPEIPEGEHDAHEQTARFLHTHRSRWTWPKLRSALERAGFDGVERASFQHGRCPDVSLLDNRPESLFVEANLPSRSRLESAS
jgi:SAM-dependent methyltransferase